MWLLGTVPAVALVPNSLTDSHLVEQIVDVGWGKRRLGEGNEGLARADISVSPSVFGSSGRVYTRHHQLVPTLQDATSVTPPLKGKDKTK